MAACKGDIDAVEFCMQIMYIGQLWDDLIDRDKIRGDAEINAAFTMVLGFLPQNRFYRQHMDSLTPVIVNAALKWQNANTLERGNDDHRMIAWIIRQSLGDIFHYVMFLVGGYGWALEHGPVFFADACPDIVAKYEEFKTEMATKYPIKEDAPCL